MLDGSGRRTGLRRDFKQFMHRLHFGQLGRVGLPGCYVIERGVILAVAEVGHGQAEAGTDDHVCRENDARL